MPNHIYLKSIQWKMIDRSNSVNFKPIIVFQITQIKHTIPSDIDKYQSIGISAFRRVNEVERHDLLRRRVTVTGIGIDDSIVDGF